MATRLLAGGEPRHHAADNILHFARVLRSAGLPVGPDRVLLAIEALEQVGVDRREDVRAALAAVMLSRHEQRPLFDAAFAAFWRDPKLLERMMLMMLPKVRGQAEPPADRNARLQQALNPPSKAPRNPPPEEDAVDPARFDAMLTSSERERLQKADFATMTIAEFNLARRLATQVALPIDPVLTRRSRPDRRGRPDLRTTMRQMLHTPDLLLPRRVSPRIVPPPLVVLLDISGSMERYSRVFLHFTHAIAQRRTVHAFVFGTRLTSISRCLRHRDPDEALARADALVDDWRGGTRIAANLARFNRDWARRVLTRNAALLLVTDGLERADGGDLAKEAALLSRFARQFIWLNPLLRFEGFEPRAAGIRAILPHVDRFLPMHNLASLADLGRALQPTNTGNRRLGRIPRIQPVGAMPNHRTSTP